jgi:hypothetical protein
MFWQASASEQKGDTFMTSLFSEENADNAAALKRALTEPFGKEGAQGYLAGKPSIANAWDSYALPAIRNNLMRKLYDPKDMLTGEALLASLHVYSEKGINKVLGPGTWSALKDLAASIEVATKSTPGKAKIWAAATAENRAIFSAIGLSTAAYASPGTLKYVIPAAIGLQIGPRYIAKALESPVLMRQLAAGIRNPGAKGVNLVRILTKLGTLTQEDDVTDAALEYAYKGLQQINRVRSGARRQPLEP